MQQSRTNASGSNHYESELQNVSKNVKIFPSKPPAHVEQHKRQKRLQRQKEIDGFYRQSTSESLPEEVNCQFNDFFKAKCICLKQWQSVIEKSF